MLLKKEINVFSFIRNHVKTFEHNTSFHESELEEIESSTGQIDLQIK